ncbi:MAG TPA: SLC13 family permease [Longimicrobiales bacterium]|nr:SLC13 family permease [Longimicrobiales bacterium]
MRRRLGLILGPAMLLLLLVPAPDGMDPGAWRTAAVGLFMAAWWITEAIPIPATALIPLFLFPVLGVGSIGESAAPYANPIIFLFMGGFLLAIAMQRWNLHRRIALSVVAAAGTDPHRLVLGFMVATAFLSMWVSNTATAVMMMPIGLSVIGLVAPDRETGEPSLLNFGTALMLGIAYSASIGGVATLIGTPPNALMAGYMLATYDLEIGFGRWMLIGLPLAVVTLPLTWLVLTRMAFPIRLPEIPGGRATLLRELRRLGPISPPERRVAAVFALTALAWVFRPFLESVVPGLNDTSIAIGAALVLFLLPSGAPSPEDPPPSEEGSATHHGASVLDWTSAEQLPWGVLILFGGGLSLADAVTRTGLAEWIGSALSALDSWPTLLLVLTVTAVVVFLTELTSNTATAAAFLPVLGPLAVVLGEDPLLLVVPAALAASCAFMMPVATPPNAIVYGSGYVTIPQMVRAGIWLNLLFIALISVMSYLGVWQILL